MAHANELVRKLLGADEKSVSPPQEGNDASVKHLWLMIAFSIGMIIFGVVIAFTGLFEV